MPRPRKIRCCEGRICGRIFKPTCTPMPKLEKIDLHRDELETLKLCDLEGLTQEQAGQKMMVSRGTIQRILTSARKKTAHALVRGAALILKEECREGNQRTVQK